MSLQSDIAAIIERIYTGSSSGVSLNDELRAELKKYVAAHPVASATLHGQVKLAAREYMKQRDLHTAAEFNKRYAASAEDQKALSQRIMPEVQRAQKQISRSTSRIIPLVMRQMEQAAADGSDWRERSKKVVRRLRLVSSHIAGEVETAKAGMDRIARMTAAMDIGVEYFRYAGPTANLRPFCAQHIGAIYHIEEIEQMNNGQGLPAWSHCGGYNCRHRWVPVTDKLGDWQQQLATDIEDSYDKRWDEVLPGVTATQISKVFSGLNQRGLGSKLLHADADDYTLEVAAGIYDISGTRVGTVKRAYHAGSADHELFALESQWQGKGVSRELLRRSLEFYDQHGITQVNVHAALDGGHIVWAKYGFEFADPYTAEEWRESMARYIRDQTGGLVSAERALIHLNDLDSPNDFITYNQVVGGSRIVGLTWKAQVYTRDWHGLLNLTKGSRSRHIFEDQLRRNEK